MTYKLIESYKRTNAINIKSYFFKELKSFCKILDFSFSNIKCKKEHHITPLMRPVK